MSTLDLRTVPVSQLRPAPYNPRIALQAGTPGYRRLARSLREFGLVQPIVWNEHTGHVVAGHQRLEILKQEGATAVDCVVVSLPIEREQALNVTLNNPHVGSDWDPDKLIDLLVELEELPDFDTTLTGFDADQLRDLVLAPATIPPPDESAGDGEPQRIVRVTLEVPADRWEHVRPDVDTLIADWNLIVHVKLPTE